MKNFTLHILFLLSMAIPGLANANTVIVKGYVKTADNKAVANKLVRISVDSSGNTSCVFTHTTISNPNGFYIDTIRCDGAISKVKISVENCNGALLINTVQPVAGAAVVESNFVICLPSTTPPTNCKATIHFQLNGITASFSSSNSVVAVGDSIIKRKWHFGDGHAADGNKNHLTHAYQKPGRYEVCLYIKTAKGCESKTCIVVEIPGTRTTCKAWFSVERLSARKFRFTSLKSYPATADTIVERNWSFGDSSFLSGHEISPTKEYKDTGAYTICLKIKTKKGCESNYCYKLVVCDKVVPPPTSCKAKIYLQLNGTTAFFSSSYSVTAAGDSIIKRKWYFGDGHAEDGNKKHLSYTYQKPGRYQVCLAIKTAKGCESKTCMVVEIPEPRKICKAWFSVEKIGARKFRFTSLKSYPAPGDTIAERSWSFGDSSFLNGHEISPTKEYKDTGAYNICLKIKTKKGCESYYCFKLKVCDTMVPPPASCKARIILLQQNGTTASFSSSYSATAAGDSIVKRNWHFGDGSASDTNKTHLTHTYQKPGRYEVCLAIKTAKGCESKTCMVIEIPETRPTCKAWFSVDRIGMLKFRFTSLKSYPATTDTIAERSWSFGDSSFLNGHEISPTKEYKDTGTYTICLKIKTRKGCESSYCFQLVVRDSIVPVPFNCKADFSNEKITLHKLRLNSNISMVAPGDSIVERRWKFGDGTSLSGNITNPVKEFASKGIYAVCLQIRTVKGCSSDICKLIDIRDSIPTPIPGGNTIRVISINPNPAITKLLATVWSKNGVNAEIHIYDIYGNRKWSGKKEFVAGNNIAEVPVAGLQTGPYFLNIVTANGRDSRMFYKL